MEDAIATARLIAIQPGGHRIPVAVAIGRPRSTDRAVACAVLLDGIMDDQPRDTNGEDEFQALALAFQFIRTMLETEEERGVVFISDGDQEPFDWRRWWFAKDCPPEPSYRTPRMAS